MIGLGSDNYNWKSKSELGQIEIYTFTDRDTRDQKSFAHLWTSLQINGHNQSGI